jgi:hypothetical protein
MNVIERIQRSGTGKKNVAAMQPHFCIKNNNSY